MKELVRLVVQSTLVPPAEDHVIVTHGVGASGELVVLWATPEARHELDGRPDAEGISYADGRLDPAVPAIVTVERPHGARTVVRLDGVDQYVPMVQAAPDGGVLVAGARSAFVDGARLPNAQLFDADGAQRWTGAVGDGLEHVQVTSDGQVWTAYFDEGVLGDGGER